MHGAQRQCEGMLHPPCSEKGGGGGGGGVTIRITLDWSRQLCDLAEIPYCLQL